MEIDPKAILLEYYDSHSELFSSLWVHSLCVKDKAERAVAESGVEVDLDFVCQAAMLHDIGIFQCHAPSIYCEGDLPYICHGICGRELLENHGLHRHALVCERHTGAGLTVEDIVRQQLPLPHRDMLPISLEEKLVCYADKFYSKSGNLTEEKTIEEVFDSMRLHGNDVAQRFQSLHDIFKKH